MQVAIGGAPAVVVAAGDRLTAFRGDGGTPAGLFRAEATSLEALRQTGALRILKVQAKRVILQIANGSQLTFDLDSRTFK